MLPWASHQAMHGGDPASRLGRGAAGADSVIYRHGKRNVQLHFGGILPIVCPAADDSQVSGLAVFADSLEEANAIMDADPPSKPGPSTLTRQLGPRWARGDPVVVSHGSATQWRMNS